MRFRRVWLDVLRAEGPASAWRRAAERFVEARRSARYARAGPDAVFDVPVLNVAPFPPAARFGGLAVQLAGRLAAERRSRPVALLFPHGRGWRLEVDDATGPSVLALAGAAPRPTALRDEAFEDVVLEAARRVRARLVHVEGLSGFPPESLGGLARRLPVVLSTHDHAAWCVRPNLVEEPVGAFCGFSRDGARCARCLSASFAVPEGFAAERRAATGEALALARLLVHPSEYLRRVHQDRFGLAAPGAVVVPGFPGARVAPRTGPFALRHAAFVGSVRRHKGGAVFAQVARALRGSGIAFSAFGGGDPALVGTLRTLGVRVHGHYRAGDLPALLVRRRVDLALLPSLWPETFSLTLSECRAAGVPVVAFDLGAIAERVREGGGGVLVPLEGGAAAIATLLADLAAGRRGAEALRPVPDEEPGFAGAAAAMAGVYRSLS